MERVSLRDSPQFVSPPGTAVAGLGHPHLRRWFGVLGWMGVTLVVSALLVEPTRTAVGTLIDPLSVPVVIPTGAGVLDASLVARVRAGTGRAADMAVSDATSAGEFDTTAGFCHRCGTGFGAVEATGPDRPADTPVDW